MFSKLRFIILSIILSTSLLSITHRAEAFEVRHNLGAGVGIPFGIFGVAYGLEINVIDSIAIMPSLALGTSVLAGSTEEVGLRLLFGDKKARIRIGVSYWSGTNTIVNTGFLSYETMKGTTAGVNLRAQFGSKRDHVLDVHILKNITPTDDELQKRFGSINTENSKGTLLGVGYMYRF